MEKRGGFGNRWAEGGSPNVKCGLGGQVVNQIDFRFSHRVWEALLSNAMFSTFSYALDDVV